MISYFHFAHPWYMLFASLFVGVVIFVRWMWYQPTLYVYSLTSFLKQHKVQALSLYSYFFYIIRLVSLGLLVVLIGKPQFVDSKSKINVEGVDIVIALDMSDSMRCFDDLHDKRTRWQVAKTEALNFIDKRDNDAVGLVIFGRYAIARCPLTHDKHVLKSIINELEIGMPSADMCQATMLSQAILISLRRLQKSPAKSKIIILLTDGMPSQGDIEPKEVIEIAQKLGVKIYTIGVGGDRGGFLETMFGVQQVGTPLNKNLLQAIAKVTGGQFFEAKKPKDLKKIYDTIDQLEKVSYETELYNKYHDYFLPIVWLVILLVLCELGMATYVWFIV